MRGGGEKLPPFLKRAVARLAAEEPVVDAPHPRADRFEPLLEVRGRRETQGAREGGQLGGVGRQRVPLVLLAHLDRVLDPPQKPVGFLEKLRLLHPHQAVAGQLVQRGGRRVGLEKGIAPGMQQLERLGDEFDFPNPAAA